MNVKDGNVGGICGYVYTSATLKLCGNNGDLSTDKSYAGGLISLCYSLNASECFNSGIITASKGYAGGLFGYVSSSSNYTLTDVYNSGKITGNYAGGLIAFSNKKVTLNNAYNTGDVVSQQNITPTKYGMSDEINYVTNKSLKVRGKDVFTNKSSNSGIKVEQYTTGGSEIDYNLNIIYSYNYDMYCADVSFVNNYMNISKKTNCYSVNPNDMTYLSWDSGPTEMNIGVQTQINNTTQQKMLKTFTFDRQEINSNKNLIVFEPKLTTNTKGVVNVECDGPEILDVNQTLDYNYTNLSRLILEKYIPYNFNNWQLYGIYVIGVTLIKQGNFFELVPLILFWYEIQESGWENRQPFKIEYVGLKEWGERVISFNVVNPQYYTVSQIKSANLGDNFAVNENINGGMPYLKNFYWQ